MSSNRPNRRLNSSGAGAVFSCLPQITDKDETKFQEELLKIHENQYTPINHFPTIFGRQISLLKMYNAVARQGGLKKMTSDSSWEEVMMDLSIPIRCGNAFVALRSIYQRYLEPFERIQRNKATISDIEEDLQLESELRYKIVSPLHLSHLHHHNHHHNNQSQHQGSQHHHLHHSHHHHHHRTGSVLLNHFNPISMVYRADLHQIDAEKRQESGLSIDLSENVEWQKLELSLRSGLDNEVDFALNSVLLMSCDATPANNFMLLSMSSNSYETGYNNHNNNSRNGLQLQLNPRLLDAVLCTVGISDIASTRLIVLQNSKMRRFLNFWDCTIEEKHPRKYLYPSVFESDFFINCDNSTASDYDWWSRESGSLFGHSNDYTEDLESIEHRIQLVATVLRNAALETNVPVNINSRIMTQHQQTMRFIILCCHSSNSAIRQIGLELIGLLRFPVVGILNKTLNRLIQRLADSDDRFDRLRGLEFVARLADPKVSGDNIQFFNSLPATFFAKLISNMIVHDLYLVVLALEAVFCLSDMDASICFRLIDSGYELLPTLCTLLSLEAQVMGSQSLIRIRVMQGPGSNQQQLVVSGGPPPATAVAAALVANHKPSISTSLSSSSSVTASNSSSLMPPPPAPPGLKITHSAAAANPSAGPTAIVTFNPGSLLSPNALSNISHPSHVTSSIVKTQLFNPSFQQPQTDQNTISNQSLQKLSSHNEQFQLVPPLMALSASSQQHQQFVNRSASLPQLIDNLSNGSNSISMNQKVTLSSQPTASPNNLKSTSSFHHTAVLLNAQTSTFNSVPATCSLPSSTSSLVTSYSNNIASHTQPVLIKPELVNSSNCQQQQQTLAAISRSSNNGIALLNSSNHTNFGIKSKEEFVKKWLLDNYIEAAQSTVPLFIIYKQLQIAVQNYFKDCEMVSAEEFHKIVRLLFPQVQLVQLQIPNGPSEIHYFNLKENIKPSAPTEALAEFSPAMQQCHQNNLLESSGNNHSTTITISHPAVNNVELDVGNNIYKLSNSNNTATVVANNQKNLKRNSSVLNGHIETDIISNTNNNNNNNNVNNNNKSKKIKIEEKVGAKWTNGIVATAERKTTVKVEHNHDGSDQPVVLNGNVNSEETKQQSDSEMKAFSCSTVSPLHCDSLVNGGTDGSSEGGSHSLSPLTAAVAAAAAAAATASVNGNCTNSPVKKGTSSTNGNTAAVVPRKCTTGTNTGQIDEKFTNEIAAVDRNLGSGSTGNNNAKRSQPETNNNVVSSTNSNANRSGVSSSSKSRNRFRHSAMSARNSGGGGGGYGRGCSSASFGGGVGSGGSGSSGSSSKTRGYSSHRPINQAQMYICEWDNCLQSFDKPQKVYGHVYTNHFMTLRTEVEATQHSFSKSTCFLKSKCLWAGCRDTVARTPLPLLNHVNEQHCNNVALESARQARLAKEKGDVITTAATTSPTTIITTTTATTSIGSSNSSSISKSAAGAGAASNETKSIFSSLVVASTSTSSSSSDKSVPLSSISSPNKKSTELLSNTANNNSGSSENINILKSSAVNNKSKGSVKVVSLIHSPPSNKTKVTTTTTTTTTNSCSSKPVEIAATASSSSSTTNVELSTDNNNSSTINQVNQENCYNASNNVKQELLLHHVISTTATNNTNTNTNTGTDVSSTVSNTNSSSTNSVINVSPNNHCPTITAAINSYNQLTGNGTLTAAISPQSGTAVILNNNPANSQTQPHIQSQPPPTISNIFGGGNPSSTSSTNIIINPLQLSTGSSAIAVPSSSSSAAISAALSANAFTAPVKEGPVTKHIRYVSASILRNLCKHCPSARRYVSNRHAHLLEMAVSGCESSKTLSECLFYSSQPLTAGPDKLVASDGKDVKNPKKLS